MITGAWTSAIPNAVYLPHLAWIGVNHLLGAFHGRGLASADAWNSRWRVRAAAASSAGETALKICRPGTQSALSAGAALRGPAAIASRTARGLGAAFDVVGSARAGIVDVHTTAGGTFGSGNANAWTAAGPSARTVLNCPLDEDIGLDGVGPDKEEDGGDER